ncbi:MAG: hypothetical protein PHP08_00405 [Candidatus Dojkabacteria bacterium]|nr:hypothetical protein [Candidatus Dojkabacteria bacterium]
MHKGTKHTKKTGDEIVNSFFIPKETIREMNELNHKTAVNGKEHGMALCLSEDRKVVPGKSSVGDYVSIMVPETCKGKHDKYIGSYHTHPRPSETRFSAMDLLSSCDEESKIDCVGMNKKGEIECYIKRNQGKSCQDEAKPFVDIEDTYVYIDPVDRETVKTALLNAVDNFTEKKFKSKKIL